MLYSYNKILGKAVLVNPGNPAKVYFQKLPAAHVVIQTFTPIKKKLPTALRIEGYLRTDGHVYFHISSRESKHKKIS